MNTRTALFVAGGVVVAAYLYSRSAAAAGGGALTVGPGPNSRPQSPGGGIFDVGGFLSVNSQLVVAEKVDAAAGQAICRYYGGGAICAQAAGTVARFNSWQTRKTLSVAKGVVDGQINQINNLRKDISSGNVGGTAKDLALAPYNTAKDIWHSVF